jgi:basic membrane protein A
MRKRRLLWALVALAVLVFALAACGGEEEAAPPAEPPAAPAEPPAAPAEPPAAPAEPPAEPPAPPEVLRQNCASEDVYCVGFATDVGRIDDKSFNQASWTALQQAQAELGVQIDYIETTDSNDYAVNIQAFLDQDYDAIVTSGFAYGEATAAAATANPDVPIIGVDQFQAEVIPNLTGVIFNEDKAGFLAGALAGLLTKTDTVAAVLGTDLVPPVVAFKVGFENGAKYTNPDVTVLSTYHPGGLDVAFVDPAWGADTARQALDQGADIVFGAGGDTGNGALAEVAKEGGAAYCIGVDVDQWETVPESHPCLITSAIKLITPAVRSLIEQAQAGTKEGGNFNGDVGLAPYHDFDAEIPQEVKDQITDLTPKVLSGEVPTGYTPA